MAVARGGGDEVSGMATAELAAAWNRERVEGSVLSRHTPRPAPLALSQLIQHAIAIMALLLLNRGGTAGSTLFFVILGLMVFHSPSSAFKAIAICYVGLMINSAFVPKTLVWTPGRLILPLLAFFRYNLDLAAMRKSLLGQRVYCALAIYVIVMAVCSILSGWYTNIALLKLFNFWAVVSGIFAGLFVLRAAHADLTEWFVSLILVTTIFGLLAIVLGVQSNYYNQKAGVLFNGAFLHPNCHSIYASQFIVYLAAIATIGRYRNVWATVPLIATWVTFMLMSQSRTAVFSTIAGLSVLFLLAKPLRNRFGWRVHLNVSRATIWLYVLLTLAVTLVLDASSGGIIRRSVVGFINKGGGEATGIDTEQMMSSRAGLIEFSWNNFLASPIYGIGFQVAKTEAFVRNATWLTAPAEKGFLPTALLEEGGVLGATTFLLFLLAYVGQLWKQRSVPALAVFAALMTCNMTEVSIFSPGGAGSFGWVMVGAALILSDHCWRPPTPLTVGQAAAAGAARG